MSISDPTIAEISMFGGNFAPRFWANCDGTLLAISQNQALFSILGTQYGGDGRTTFALPDLRSRVPIHAGQGPGLSSRSQGQTGGSETTTLTVPNLPAHGHTVSLSSNEEGNTSDPNGAFVANNSTNNFATSTDGSALAATTSGNTGNNQAFNNMQPFGVVRYIIALQGIFPSRN